MSASIARHCSYEIHPPSKSEEEMSPALTRQTVSLTRNVAELVAAQAAAAPHALAIAGNGAVMTYGEIDRKSTRLNSSHTVISYAVFCLKKKKTKRTR